MTPDLRLAYELIQICAEVNDGHGLTLECENAACRVYLPDNVEMPMGVPEGTALVVFAGSNDIMDWIKDICIIKKIFPKFGPVHGGIYDCFKKIQNALDIHLQGCHSVIFAGHSLGGAMSPLAAAWWWSRGPAYRVPAVYTFGSPRQASEKFRDSYRAAGIPTFRFVVGWDAIPRHPGSLEDYHCGVGYFYTADGIPCKEQRHPAWWAPWRWLWAAVDNHLAANEYTRALRRAAAA